jgi:phosphatidylinositol glycan class O
MFPPCYDNLVVILIDGLRFDMLEPNAHKSGNAAHDYIGMPSVHRLLQSEPDRCLLYKFIADPPTVTMQRLKVCFPSSG